MLAVYETVAQHAETVSIEARLFDGDVLMRVGRYYFPRDCDGHLGRHAVQRLLAELRWDVLGPVLVAGTDNTDFDGSFTITFRTDN